MIDHESASQRIFPRHQKILALFMFAAALTIAPGTNSLQLLGASEAHEKLDRNQSMLINLKSAPLSAGYYIIHSYGNSKLMTHDLAKALSQIEEVDKAYAKSRQNPDKSYLESACLKITVARQTAQQLQMQLSDAYAELKSSIEETLVTDAKFK